MDTKTLTGKRPLGADDQPVARTVWERVLEKLPYALWGITVLVIVARWAMMLE